jgi:hypothetical protein
LILGDDLTLMPTSFPLDKVNYFSDQHFKKYGEYFIFIFTFLHYFIFLFLFLFFISFSMYYIWFWYEPVLMISNAKALSEFYRDHFEHIREPSFTCCGSIFERLMVEKKIDKQPK